MRILTITFLGLLLAGFPGSHSFAENAADEDSQGIEVLINTLETNVEALRFLMDRIETTQAQDREVLVYRQDERVFKLLVDFDVLANIVADLPEGSEEKLTGTRKLTELVSGLDFALFNRIAEIKQNIIEQSAQLTGLGGSARVAAQANIRSLEYIRIKYYEGLVNHIESRKALGLTSAPLREKLVVKLYLYAEILAGRIEYSDVARENVETLQTADPGNADIASALTDLNARHDANIFRLEDIILLLDRLGQPSSDYKAVMLQQASNLSISFFSSNAILTVLADSWVSLKEAIAENGPDLALKILLFVFVLLIFRALSRITKRVVRVATEKSSLDMSELLGNILVSTSGGLVMALGVLMALSQVGISLAPMLAGLGVAGFIVGFALQDSLGNFAAGAMILIYRPFDVNDFVEVTGASGLVKKMNLVSTTILTFDNQTLIVPNSKIWGDVIKNVTAQKERRVDLEFGIGYDDDIELAERVLTEIVSAHEKVLDDPEPNIKLHTLGDSSVNFIVRPWVKTDDYWDVYWDIMREVKLRFDREGISIPFPQRDVHLYSEQET